MITKVTAHAGCEGTRAGSKENIVIALASGADVIEMDLRALNGQIYLSHGPLEADRLDTYLTFQQALELLKNSDVEVNCDLKEEEAFQIALDILKKMGMQERALFTGEIGACSQAETGCRCFYNVEHYHFAELGKQLSESDVCQLIEMYQKDGKRHISGFNVEYSMLTHEAMDLFAKEQVPISCWLVDEEHAIRKLLSEHVSYITTNCVKYAVSQRELMP